MEKIAVPKQDKIGKVRKGFQNSSFRLPNEPYGL